MIITRRKGISNWNSTQVHIPVRESIWQIFREMRNFYLKEFSNRKWNLYTYHMSPWKHKYFFELRSNFSYLLCLPPDFKTEQHLLLIEKPDCRALFEWFCPTPPWSLVWGQRRLQATFYWPKRDVLVSLRDSRLDLSPCFELTNP